MRVSLMQRSIKVKQYLGKPKTKPQDDFGLFGVRFTVPKPVMDKQMDTIPIGA